MKQVSTNSTPSTQRIFLDVFKWLFALLFTLMGIITIFSSSFVGGLFIILGAIVLTPFVSSKLKQKFSIWKYRAVRLIATLGIVFFGIVFSNRANKEKPSFNKHHEVIRKYVEINKDKPFLKNLQLLEEWNYVFETKNTGERTYYFSNRYSEVYIPLDSLKDSSVVYGLFLENNKDKTLNTHKYLKSIPDYGQLYKYFVTVTVNNKNEITKAVGMFGNTNDDIKEIADQNFDLSQYTNLEVIKTQTEKSEKELAEIQEREQEERYREELADKKANWEDQCISSWDGSCTKLKLVFKRYLKDPDSFEHIETRFKKMDDYVLVIMQYRAKNSFGAYDTGTVTAEVSYDCEVLEISE